MSFATYASQFINRNNTSPSSNSNSNSESHPMFFSFTTASDGDGDEDDGDHRAKAGVRSGVGGGAGAGARSGFGLGFGLGLARSEVRGIPSREEDEEDDEELRLAGGSSRGFLADMGMGDIDDEEVEDEDENADPDPYLRLDQAQQQQQVDVEDEVDSDSDSVDSLPSGMIASTRRERAAQPQTQRGRTITLASSSLTESLLPHGDDDTVVFNLPDPRKLSSSRARGRRKYNDALWTTIWLSGVCVCYISAFILLFTTSTKAPSSPNSTPTPYPTLLHTIPLLIPLILLSALASYIHILFLRVWLRPVMWASALGTPVLLFGCALWAWAGSFGLDGDADAESTGLRIFSLLPLLLSLYLFYRLYRLYTTFTHTLPLLQTQLAHTEAILRLTTAVLTANPFLLGLSPVLLFGALVGSIPFAVMVGRLLLVGYWTRSAYHLKWIAELGIIGGVAVWLWSWGVVRGVLRVVSAGVVGGWYFGVDWDVQLEVQDAAVDADLAPPPTMFADTEGGGFIGFPARASTHTLHASLHRATHTSLGSIALSALLHTLLRFLSILTLLLMNLPYFLASVLSSTVSFGSFCLPPPVAFAFSAMGSSIANVALLTRGWFLLCQASGWMLSRAIGRLEGVMDKMGMGEDTLVYVGLTGKAFWDCARLGRKVNANVNHSRSSNPNARFHPKPSSNFGIGSPIPLILSPSLSLPLPFSLFTYLFISYPSPWGLGAPHYALTGAVIAALTTGVVGLFCTGVVSDVGACLDVCAGIDGAEGVGESDGRKRGIKERREMVRKAFQAPPPASRQQRAQRQPPMQHPTRPPPQSSWQQQTQTQRYPTPAQPPPPPRTRYEEYPSHPSHHGALGAGADSSPESIDVMVSLPISPVGGVGHHVPVPTHVAPEDIDPFAPDPDPSPYPHSISHSGPFPQAETSPSYLHDDFRNAMRNSGSNIWASNGVRKTLPNLKLDLVLKMQMWMWMRMEMDSSLGRGCLGLSLLGEG
ncbi:hypothetical protein BT96DRAFT_1014630 [Gymnopus androsaceus JB14]|uniref:Uncharacterized protein n=1 Tax=Gymnopus androsaceus JB14 TaxID=1447944 RepID=A0A6A4IBI9_9AGAR|nr:hypothetical protein BT96DRAFT_1014630 [Gymnopus androsaceus JB14]